MKCCNLEKLHVQVVEILEAEQEMTLYELTRVQFNLDRECSLLQSSIIDEGFVLTCDELSIF